MKDLLSSFEKYVEVIVPGSIIIAVLSAVAPPETSSLFSGEFSVLLLENSLIVSILFLASSYLLGTISILISRWAIKLLVDRIRFIFLRQYPNQTRNELNREFRLLYQKGLKSPEIFRRRERARVIRSSFALFALIGYALTANSRPLQISTVLGIYFLVLTLVIFAEKSLYDESRRVQQLRKSKCAQEKIIKQSEKEKDC